MPDCDRSVLVVEDDPYIRESVAEVLKDDGYRVETASHGREALELLNAHERRPCVVLVDLMLPVMTGWELVTEMRNDPALSAIPVVVTSAASDRAPPNVDRVLPKPLHLDTLLDTVCSFCQQREVPDPKSGAVRELARRNVELAELRRFRDEMAALIVHDLKNPLAIVAANVEFAARSVVVDPEAREALDDALTGVARAQRIVGNLLDLTRMETGVFLPNRARVPIDTVLMPLLTQRRTPARTLKVSLESKIALDVVEIDADLVSRAVENVVDNALRFTPRFGRVSVEAAVSNGVLTISVGNSGDPIPPEARATVFEKYGQAAPASGRLNLGLGLYFCRLVAESHGGRIFLEERPDLPVVFTLELPANV